MSVFIQQRHGRDNTNKGAPERKLTTHPSNTHICCKLGHFGQVTISLLNQRHKLHDFHHSAICYTGAHTDGTTRRNTIGRDQSRTIQSIPASTAPSHRQNSAPYRPDRGLGTSHGACPPCFHASQRTVLHVPCQERTVGELREAWLGPTTITQRSKHPSNQQFLAHRCKTLESQWNPTCRRPSSQTVW